jgi:hypothetical protein
VAQTDTGMGHWVSLPPSPTVEPWAPGPGPESPLTSLSRALTHWHAGPTAIVTSAASCLRRWRPSHSESDLDRGLSPTLAPIGRSLQTRLGGRRRPRAVSAAHCPVIAGLRLSWTSAAGRRYRAAIQEYPARTLDSALHMPARKAEQIYSINLNSCSNNAADYLSL